MSPRPETVSTRQVGVQRADARVVEAGGDTVGLGDLPVLVLDDERVGAVEHTGLTQRYGGRREAAVYALAAGLGQDDLDILVVEVVVDGAGGVAASAHTGYQVVGLLTAFVGLQLYPDLGRDDRLQARHHVGVGVRSYGRADDVVGILGVAAPVAYGLVGGVLEGHIAARHGYHSGSEHLHLLYIEMLALHIGLAHVDGAGQAAQRADGSRGYAVLTGAGLGHDALLAHALSQQYLSQSVVYLVGSGVIEVLALEVDAAAVSGAQPVGQIEGRRATGVVTQQRREFILKVLALDDAQVVAPQIVDTFVQYLRYICAAVDAVIAVLVY